ncbi:MAG TPA: hypothetical protein VGM51_17260 [Armatimonadota bacterium]|jgi:uncharacterized protein YrrD
MKIINQHLGLPVISRDTSERVGDVLRFVTDQVTGRIVAVAVTTQWYQEPSAVAFADCTAFGQNVVLVKSGDALKPLSQIPEIGIHLQASSDSRQRTAITESGRLLGSVTDEAFDEHTGEVVGYRLDILADSGTGRTVYIGHEPFVTASATVAILKDDVLAGATDELVPSSAPLAPIPEPSAPSSAPNPQTPAVEVQPSVPEFPASLLALTEEALEPEESDEELADTVSQEVRDKMEGHNRVMMALVIGKTAGATVTDSEGSVIAEEGVAITMDMAQAAADSQRLYELWTNARD